MAKLGPVMVYRCSHYLKVREFNRLSRLLDYLNRFIFGCWVPGSIIIGRGLVLGYWGMAIVVHSDCKLGDHVHIDQCVTLGGNGVDFGVPELGSDIYIGAGAKVLGPVKIGDNCIVAANAVVLNNVPEGSVVAGVPARVIKTKIKLATHLHHLQNK